MSISSIYNENLNNLSSEKNVFDRFIPNRRAMKKNSAMQAYHVERPSNPYQTLLYKTLFSNRQANQPILALSDHTLVERKQEYLELGLDFKGLCSEEITKPCSWNDNTLTLAVKNRLYTVDMLSQREMSCFLKDNENINAFSWDTNHSKLAIAHNHNGLKLWDKNADILYWLRRPTYEVRVSQMEWKNQNLIGMGYNLEFSLIDQRTTETALQHFNFEDYYSGFHFSKNEHQVYFTTSTGSIKTIDVRTEKVLSAKKIAKGLITHFELIDSNRVITSSQDGCIRIFDLQKENFNYVKGVNTNKPILGLALFEDICVTSHPGGEVVYRDLKDYSSFGKKIVPELRFLFADASKKRLGVLKNGSDSQLLSFYRH